MKKRKKVLNWGWIKENFWNVVLIWLIWQAIITVIYAMIILIFGIPAQ